MTDTDRIVASNLTIAFQIQKLSTWLKEQQTNKIVVSTEEIKREHLIEEFERICQTFSKKP